MKTLGLLVLLYAVALAKDCDTVAGKACVDKYAVDTKNEETKQAAALKPDYSKLCGIIQKILTCIEVPVRTCSDAEKKTFEKKFKDHFLAIPYNCTGLTFNPNGGGKPVSSLFTVFALILLAVFLR